MIFSALKLFWEQVLDGLPVVTTDRLTNISNYSGIHRPENDYKKFDIVYHSGDGRFYYARDDISFGNSAIIDQANRLSLIPDGPSTSQGKSHYILDSANTPDALGAEIKAGQVISISNTTGDNDGKYKVIQVNKNVFSLNGDPSLTGASIQVIGIDNYSIDNLELESPNPISLSALTVDVDGDEGVWSKDLFFFDADYDSSVKFQCNNYKYEYGDGYFINQPKNINSVSMEVDLKFKNRTNREANAIVHFLENHQGQHEKDSSSPNFVYSQGISGFRWDGASSFHPYDSTNIQTKDFYCSEFSHSLNFENSNDISLRLRNLNTSLLRKSEGMFVNRAEDYDESEFYEMHDVVFYTGNHQYYYWQSETSSSNLPPVGYLENPLPGQDNYYNTNTQYWTRDFYWKPSLGLSISQKPRMHEISLGAGYTQIYQDGINESLLKFDVTFANRSDKEARAILHFLEQHYGCIPFPFKPPAPYDKKKNFVCEEWNHSYKYKDNHTITAKFEESPFGFTPQMMQNATAKSSNTEGEIILDANFNVLSRGDPVEFINVGETFRFRVPIENIGDEPVTLESISISNQNAASFYILGHTGTDCPVIVEKKLSREDYILSLPTSSDLGIFSGKVIKMRKNFEPGIRGGYTFVIVGEESLGSFIQYNTMTVQSLLTGQTYFPNYFVNTPLIENKMTNIIQGGEKGFIEVVFDGISYQSDQYYIDDILSSSGGRFIIGSGKNYEYANINIVSDSRFTSVNSNIRIYIN